MHDFGTIRVNYGVSNDGYPRLRWNEIEGADEYLILEGSYGIKTGFGYCKVLARTKDTEFTYEDDSTRKFDHVMNDRFKTQYGGSDDLKEHEPDLIDKEFAESMYNFDQNYSQKQLMVIAINGDKYSAVSNMMPYAEYSSMLPYDFATRTNAEEENTGWFDSISELPTEVAINMCDGKKSRRTLEFDYDDYEIKQFYGNSYTLSIKGKASGTSLKTGYYVSFYLDSENGYETVQELRSYIDSELAKIKETQEKLDTNSGSKEITFEEVNNREVSEKPVQTEEPVQTETPIANDNEMVNIVADVPITANSAMSEYIAVNLLGYNQAISLKAFSESGDSEVVFDAAYEAYYQNPLCLGLQGFRYDTENRILPPIYEETNQADFFRKQSELIDESKRVVSEIIKDGMSEYEKEVAINDYLCDTAEYDYDALESAEKNNFKEVDPEYYDAFTPYGILIKKKGVCASYAGAFKILADQAGLECRVITGALNGNLPHAWNRVKVNGEWGIIDSTNNDNEYFKNAYFNLSEESANGILVQDELFAIDDNLGDYKCNTNENEYYRMLGRYLDKDEIAGKMIEELETANESVFRTDYDLENEEALEILKEVQEATLPTILEGGNCMGIVIARKTDQTIPQ